MRRRFRCPHSAPDTTGENDRPRRGHLPRRPERIAAPRPPSPGPLLNEHRAGTRAVASRHLPRGYYHDPPQGRRLDPSVLSHHDPRPAYTHPDGIPTPVHLGSVPPAEQPRALGGG